MLRDHFEQLSAVIQRYRVLWQFTPFAHSTPPWLPAYSDLGDALYALPSASLTKLLNNDEQAQKWIAPFLPDLVALQDDWLSSATADTEQLPFWLTNGIKGRKLSQITAFTAQLPSSPKHWVEWCAGKGHLGRAALFGSAHQVTSIEWQQSLCQSGQRLADQHHYQQHFIHADVLRDDVSDCINQQCGVMALHACGQLHMQLLSLAKQQRVPAVMVSPCCYHLIQGEQYTGMSQVAQRQSITLNKLDLKLPLQQLVTTGLRGQRLRDTELLWRLSFSHYVSLLTGEPVYTPLPNFAKSLLTDSYEDFCRWACAEKSIPFVANLLLDSLALGEQQQYDLARMELVRQRFRKPLEHWLILDRALYLEEAGYQVEVMRFCDFSVTPRNLLIKAHLAN
ncbi:SAM-dependent methyltransferase [Motilimonas cestriensis]|uniref:SAM-dependent methyltransferase n=1 Tax=Motilimonas cestriensis TaxID=2742685 RepID=A0ABS8WB44_9GAMM|nr:methyltransferase [Motilimonas cestriensis]MCE2595738.1 SAM-dependent methyltransferase [Motilimonas cestriensis]